MKKLVSLFLAVLMAFCLFGCAAKTADKQDDAQTSADASTDASSDNASTEESKEPIYVGVLAPLTGSMAEYGKSFEVAMTMKMEEVNAAGGINGRELVLDFADSKGDQNESADLASRFAEDDKYVAILGDFASGCSMAAAPICDEAGIVLLAPTASTAAFAPMSVYAFSLAGRSSAESAYDAEYAIKKYSGANTVAVFYLNSDYGVTAFEAFEESAAACGLEIVCTEAYSDTETDFAALITKAKAENPEHVAIIDQANTASVINQIRGSGWDVPITMIGISTNTQVLELCGENVEGVLCSATVNFNENDPVTGPFLKEYTERAGFGPTQMAGYAYDSVAIISEALIACGDDITRDNVRDRLAETDGTYLTGPIKFTEVGDLTRTYLIYQVENGEYVLKCDYDYANQ